MVVNEMLLLLDKFSYSLGVWQHDLYIENNPDIDHIYTL